MNNTFKKRIDELGRIVIPKQIRNTFKIKNFDELELFIEDDNIVIRKTGGILLIRDKLNRLLNFIKKYFNINAIVVDKNIVVATNISEIKNDSNINIDFNEYNNNQDLAECKIDDEVILKGYLKNYQLIYDSNLYGTILFVLDEPIEKKQELLSDIVNLILEFIN